MKSTTLVTQGVNRVANRAKREVIARVPAVNTVVQHRHEGRVRRYQASLPALEPRDRELVARLKTDAIHIGTLDELGLPDTEALQEELARLTALLADRPPAGLSTVRPSPEELLESPLVWRWGLSERMLDIAENYLGLPARYYGGDVRREVADNKPMDVRQWHRDIEDDHVLKILVWLNDVDDDGGPFAYIPRARSQEAVRRLRYVGGFVPDDKLAQIVPRQEWRTATGPQWTAVMPDTAQLMHRATPPRARDRYSVTFTWTNRHPRKTIPKAPLSVDQRRRVMAELSPRQLACLPVGFEVDGAQALVAGG